MYPHPVIITFLVTTILSVGALPTRKPTRAELKKKEEQTKEQKQKDENCYCFKMPVISLIESDKLNITGSTEKIEGNVRCLRAVNPVDYCKDGDNKMIPGQGLCCDKCTRFGCDKDPVGFPIGYSVQELVKLQLGIVPGIGTDEDKKNGDEKSKPEGEDEKTKEDENQGKEKEKTDEEKKTDDDDESKPKEEEEEKGTKKEDEEGEKTEKEETKKKGNAKTEDGDDEEDDDDDKETKTKKKKTKEDDEEEEEDDEEEDDEEEEEDDKVETKKKPTKSKDDE